MTSYWEVSLKRYWVQGPQYQDPPSDDIPKCPYKGGPYLIS